MSGRQQILERLRTVKQSLADKYAVSELALFGSYSRGEQQTDSDVDILVSFSKPIGIRFIDLADELEKLLNCRVDLVSSKGVKPRYFKSIKEDLVYV